MLNLNPPDKSKTPKTEKKKTMSTPDTKSNKTKTAILAGGCFWGVEELIRNQPGVLSTQVGYTGGSIPNPTYEIVKKGSSGHAESIEIQFDPSKTSYENILKILFLKFTIPLRKINKAMTSDHSTVPPFSF